MLDFENQGVALSDKDRARLEKFYAAKPLYDSILAALHSNVSEEVSLSPAPFMKRLAAVLPGVEKKWLEKIADGLSVMDKGAEIQRDRKGDIIWDKETKDAEIVRWDDTIEDYMHREVLPHISDAQAFFEENLSAKKPIIKVGAEIPFTRYFYKYRKPTPSEELEEKFLALEESVTARVKTLFSEE